MIMEMEMEAFYLVTTEHLTDRLWFRNEDDFKAGMNTVAVVKHLTGIDVLSFILMSNHVHFVLCGTREQAEHFIFEIKRHYAAYLQKKYGFKEYLRRNQIDIQKVWREDESLERAIAYVQMNSVAANICLHASAYPWGTGDAFFNLTTPQGVRLGELSKRARMRQLQSKSDLPAGWISGNDGYILPRSYVPTQFVESIFRTPNRLNYFLQNSSKAKRRTQAEGSALPTFRDQSILNAIPDLCQSLFRKGNIDELTPTQQSELVKQVKRRFSADINQIGRIVGLSYAETARLLDSL